MDYLVLAWSYVLPFSLLLSSLLLSSLSVLSSSTAAACEFEFLATSGVFGNGRILGGGAFCALYCGFFGTFVGDASIFFSALVAATVVVGLSKSGVAFRAFIADALNASATFAATSLAAGISGGGGGFWTFLVDTFNIIAAFRAATVAAGDKTKAAFPELLLPIPKMLLLHLLLPLRLPGLTNVTAPSGLSLPTSLRPLLHLLLPRRLSGLPKEAAPSRSSLPTP
jgi:hypothetical protein